MKASAVINLQDIPNIGPAMIEDFKKLEIYTPADLKKQDAFALYQKLCALTHTRHDPCVLDTFIAAVQFMNGAPAHPWWHYTAERKRNYPTI